MFQELDVVKLKEDFHYNQEGYLNLGYFPKGTRGTIVHVYSNGDAYEVEVLDQNNDKTIAVITVLANEIMED